MRADRRHLECPSPAEGAGGWAVGRLQKTPQMGAAFSFLPKIDAVEMCVFCNFQKLKVVCLLESLTPSFMHAVGCGLPGLLRHLPLGLKWRQELDLWAQAPSLLGISRQVAGTLFASAEEPRCPRPPPRCQQDLQNGVKNSIKICFHPFIL